jgi:hypothetical protein
LPDKPLSSDFIKDQALGILECCVAIFTSVWVVHGSDHALKPSVLIAMAVVGVLAGLSNLVLPGIKRTAFTPTKVVFYTLGFIAFGAFILAVGWL